MKTLLVGTLLLAGDMCFAQGVSVDSVALDIARRHNENSAELFDNMTVSSTAQARGKNVRITNVIRVKRGLPQAKRNEFQISVYEELVPKACKANAQNVAFDKGMYYTFLYFNTYGEKLAEFIVNKRACGKE